MWLMTKHGFYSIVQKKQGEFHVRARVRKDLENLQERVPLAGREIQSSKELIILTASSWARLRC